MSSNILHWRGKTVIQLDPDHVLDSSKTLLTDVVVVGWDKDDRLYVSASLPKLSEVIYLLRLTENHLIDTLLPK